MLGCISSVPSETITSLKQAVAPIVCIARESPRHFVINEQYVAGTSFFVNTGAVLLPEHVLAGIRDYASSKRGSHCIPGLYVPILPQATHSPLSVRAYVLATCHEDPAHDVAACGLVASPFYDEEVKAHVRAVDWEQIAQQGGTPVACTGFPQGSTIPVTSRGVVAANKLGQGWPEQLVIHLDVWHGSSGSPVYLSSGKLIGMIIRKRDGGISYAVPTAVIRKDLLGWSISSGSGA